MSQVTDKMPRAEDAASRGERLYPYRSSRLYWHLTSLRREYEDVIRRFVEPHRRETLVDFGCGNMPYRPLFEPLVGRYLGCDLSGNEAADRILEQPDQLPFGDGTVDIVLSSQVLEHCEEPRRYLSECGRGRAGFCCSRPMGCGAITRTRSTCGGGRPRGYKKQATD